MQTLCLPEIDIAEFCDEDSLIILDHNIPDKLADITDINSLLPWRYQLALA